MPIGDVSSPSPYSRSAVTGQAEVTAADPQRLVGRPGGVHEHRLVRRLAHEGDGVVAGGDEAHAAAAQRVDVRGAGRSTARYVASRSWSHVDSSHGNGWRPASDVLPPTPTSSPANTIGTPGIVSSSPTPTR